VESGPAPAEERSQRVGLSADGYPREWRAGSANNAVVIIVSRNVQKNGTRSRRSPSLRALARETTSGVVANSRGSQELVAVAPVVESAALSELCLEGELLDRAFHFAFCAAINSR
jgi:hypothetical protein